MVVVPVVAPVTSPAVLIDAMLPAELLQVPPGVASLSTVVVPEHITDAPAMAAGVAYTVTTAVTVEPP